MSGRLPYLRGWVVCCAFIIFQVSGLVNAPVTFKALREDVYWDSAIRLGNEIPGRVVIYS